MVKPSVAYEYKDALYLNITNKCPTACVFCIKRKWKMQYRGYNLNLKNKEPSLKKILSAISKKFSEKKYSEIVFCGYGEPTSRFEIIKKICKEIRKGNLKKVPKNIRIRINTNGLGNLVNGKNIIYEMIGLIDSLNISLNTLNKKQWLEIMAPMEKYRKDGFNSVIDFIKEAKNKIPEVVITAVDLKGIDIDRIKAFSKRNGLKFRLRPILK